MLLDDTTSCVVIGSATLYLADCLDIVPGLGFLDALVTDPPYGMQFRSNFRNIKHEAICNDTSVDCMLWACRLPVRHSRYIFGRWDNLTSVPRPTSVITWAKNNWSMGDLAHEHARQTEIIMFYPGSDHSFPGSRPSDFVEAARTTNEYHPSEKPVALMEQIVDWTEGTVVDPFMGSGSTGIACMRRGRQFIGIESDPTHFRTAQNRLMRAHKEPALFEVNALPVQVPPARFMGARGGRRTQSTDAQLTFFEKTG